MTIRLFRWSDLDGYAGVVAAGGRPYTAGLAEEYLRQPNLSPERDCFVVEGDGRLDGFTLVVPEPVLGRVILEGAVRPDARGRGHGRALLAAALDHGRALGANIAHISALPDQTDALRLFRAAGFEEVKRQWQMRLELGDFVLREVDTSYETAEMRPGEESIMTALQNAAFGESWGFAPNLPEEIAYRVRMAGSTPGDVLLLRVAGEPAAYCWTRLEPSPDGGAALGIIWMIGSDPAKRGLGLGRAMINESIRALTERGAAAVELTVYADNDPAVGLYRSVGFRHKHDIIWCEKALTADV